MNWLLAAILCALLVELALRLPFVVIVDGMRKLSSKAMHVVREKAVSDHWKEKAMGAYARSTFKLTMKLAALLALVLAVAYVLVLAFDRLSGGFQFFILAWPGLVFSFVFACIYLVTRRMALRVTL